MHSLLWKWNNPSLDCYRYHLAFLRSIHSFPSILLLPWIYCTAAMTSYFLLFISDPFKSIQIQSSQPRDGPHEIRAITLFENTCILIHQSVCNFNKSSDRDLPKAAAPATRSERRARTRILYKMIMIWWGDEVSNVSRQRSSVGQQIQASGETQETISNWQLAWRSFVAKGY